MQAFLAHAGKWLIYGTSAHAVRAKARELGFEVEHSDQPRPISLTGAAADAPAERADGALWIDWTEAPEEVLRTLPR